MPESSRSKVVLPAPTGPSTPTFSPGAMFRFSIASASLPLYWAVTASSR